MRSTTHTAFVTRTPNLGTDTVYGNKESQILETTRWSRGLQSRSGPTELGFYNKVCGKKQLSDVIWRCYKAVGQARTVETLDRLKEMGFTRRHPAPASPSVSPT